MNLKAALPIFCVLGLMITGTSSAQKKSTPPFPEFTLSKSELEFHMRFLASDELQGRRTGEQGNQVASRYIAEQFRKLGIHPAPGQSDYFQRVPFEKTVGSGDGWIVAGNDSLITGRDMIVLSGLPIKTRADIVYAGYGLEDASKGWDDFKGLDVRGKIVLVQSGLPESQTPREAMNAAVLKRKIAADKGAIAVIELFNATSPWNLIARFMGGERMTLAERGGQQKVEIPHFWANGKDPRITRILREARTVSLSSTGKWNQEVVSNNVVAYIEGTDPKLNDEYIMISAHFDHIGMGKQGGQPYTPEDSIFNGARDNAFGTVALLSAAQALAKSKPKRSVLLVAFTGEELGLLGSRYYAEHPMMPLNKCIFNLNNDGAGYNDVSLIAVLGLKRTGAKEEIEKAAKAFGLSVIGDPAAEQNLFDRSDNVNFAVKGIPSPTFSPGFRDFDAALMKTYHQAADNPETVDFDYLLKFCQTYCYAARLIADRPVVPKWEPGDKYEAAGKKLYGE